MNSHRGGNHYAGYLIDPGNEDDCLLGDEYVKVFTTGSTEAHRETRGKPTFPVFPCVPCGKDLVGCEEASAAVTSVPLSLTKLFKNILASPRISRNLTHAN